MWIQAVLAAVTFVNFATAACDEGYVEVPATVTFHSTASAPVPFTTAAAAQASPPSTTTTATQSPVATELTLVASASTMVAGGFMQFSWTNANTSSMNDWIAFTPSGSPSASNYFPDAWQYTYGSQILQNRAVAATGTVHVKVPAILGTYTAYYCLAGTFSCPANATVTVIAPQVTCRAPGETASKIKHVITIISENHSFDSYYGKYCQAAPGSNPTCTTGPACCESARVPTNKTAFLLNDAQNVAFDPCHSIQCEVCEIGNGDMMGYFDGCPGASNPKNFAFTDGTQGSASEYWKWASQYAMSDRFFQSAAGASEENDMYFARGAFVFYDNQWIPNPTSCWGTVRNYQDPTIADLLAQCDIPFSFYAQGYAAQHNSTTCWPQYYDAGDNPFAYFPSLTNSSNSASYFKDFDAQFFSDVATGTLPAVSYFKALGTACEHPQVSTISAGEAFNAQVINAIMTSPLYKDNTIIILTPDESGGFWDGITPPSPSAIDGMPYGPRTPFVVLGEPVKKNYISHVQMEPASLIRFIESNWFADAPGQLHTRDGVVNNIGDLLDAGYAFP
ncbi:hypothetical protein HDU98_002646 [Podochytrium sp. JEL0797]|nr:hypothetical protein HDU98_002646 [Podochytrium sp. JEL0797]